MEFGFSPDEQAYRDAVRDFATRALAPHYQPDDAAATLRPELVHDMAGMGLTGLRVPERHAGQGASAVAAGIAAEEVGRADVNAAYIIVNTALISDILLRNATPDQQEAWLAPIARGEALPALCVTEPEHGTDAAHIGLRATPDGDGWTLAGEKTSITLGMFATTALLLARTTGDGARGVSAFYVDLHDPRVHRAGFDDLGGRSIGRASLFFDGVPVSPDRLVGAPGDGFVSVMQAFDYSRAVIGLACLGAASQSLDEALEWARERVAFGQPIGRFEGVAFPLADAATRVRGARLLCYEALWRKDAGLPHSTEAAMAKLWAPRLAVDVIHRCLLTFGHTGYSSEHPIGQRLRDVIGLEIGDGTAQASKLVISRGLLGRAFAP